MREIYPSFVVSLLSLLVASVSAAAPSDAPKYGISSARKPGQIDRVTTLLEVTGSVIQPTGPKGEKTQKVPIEVVCNRDYDEKTLEVPAEPGGRWRSIRHYDLVKATVKEGDRVETPLLRPERSLIGIAMVGRTCTVFSPRGSLNEGESELLNAVGNSLLVDQFLPTTDVKPGDHWRTPDQALAVLLDLEEVTSNKVETTLKEVTPAVARLEIIGQVEGKRYGAAAVIEMKAKCRFDMKTRRVDWFAMRVKQTREPSLVLKALDVTVQLQIQVTAKEASPPLTETALKDLPLEPTEDLCQVVFQPADGGWELPHDRCWFPFDHHRDLTIFYMLEGGQQIAFCRLSPLPQVKTGKIGSLSEFQDDVKKALDKKHGELVEAKESAEADRKVYRVVVKGQEGELAVLWHYYLVTDPQGRQMSVAFGLEAKKAEQFGQAGERLVKSLRFVEAKPAGK